MSGRRFWRALSGNWIGELMIRAPQLAIDLLVMRMLSDTQLGVWVGLRAALQLAASLGSVPLSGLDLEYSYAMGETDRRRARDAAGSASLAVAGLTLVTVLVLLPGIVSSGFRNILVIGASSSDFAAFVAFVAIQGAYNFFVTHLRNQLKFLHVNATILVGSVLTLGLAVLLTPIWGVWGVLAAYSGSYTLCSVVWFRWSDMQLPPLPQVRAIVFKLCETGAALAAVAVAISGLRLVTRWFIGQQLGESALGRYGVAATVAGVVFVCGTAPGRLIKPLSARAVGAKISPSQQTIQFALLPGIAIAGASAMACIGVAGASQWLIPIWAPQHAQAIETVRPVLYAASVLGVALVLVSTLRAQSRQRELLLACAAACAIQLVLLFGCALSGWGLWGFAVLEIATYFAFMISLLRLLDCQVHQRRVFAYCVSAAFVLMAIATETSMLLSPPTSLPAVVACTACATAIFAPWFLFAFWAVRRLRRIDTVEPQNLLVAGEPNRIAA